MPAGALQAALAVIVVSQFTTRTQRDSYCTLSIASVALSVLRKSVKTTWKHYLRMGCRNFQGCPGVDWAHLTLQSTPNILVSMTNSREKCYMSEKSPKLESWDPWKRFLFWLLGWLPQFPGVSCTWLSSPNPSKSQYPNSFVDKPLRNLLHSGFELTRVFRSGQWLSQNCNAAKAAMNSSNLEID